MKTFLQGTVVLLTVMWMTVRAAETEHSYFDRLMEASKKQKGVLFDTSLVDTNNCGPNLTNAQLSYSRFAERGELAGLKLGMTMSEVVAAWGKPRWLFAHCFIGPRFGYGFGSQYGDRTLFFVGDRLVVIQVYGSLAELLVFDNGLRGTMSRSQCEKLLGTAIERPDDPTEGFFVGDIFYRTGGVRTGLGFHRGAGGEHLLSIAACLEEALGKRPVEPYAAPNAAPPHR